jgi:dTMP kinase
MKVDLRPHKFKGRLIVVDGMQRSGKSTVAQEIQEFLNGCGINTVFTEWNSIEALKAMTDKRKWDENFTPMTFLALHFADFVVRHEEVIVPALERGDWVVADRFIYTALCRDGLHKVAKEYIGSCYSFAVKPDAALFYLVSPDEAYKRHLVTGRGFSPYNSGSYVLGNSMGRAETYIAYQKLVSDEYKQMSTLYEIPIFDGEQQKAVVWSQTLAYLQNLFGKELPALQV